MLCTAKSQNCKNWNKYLVELPFRVDETCFDFFKRYGKLELLDFSKFSRSSKIFFKVNQPNQLMIEGVLGSNQVQFSFSKSSQIRKDIIFNELEQWLISNQKISYTR